MKQFLFIIGCPRSGTTWLQAMIGAHPNVVTIKGFGLFDRYVRPLLQSRLTESALERGVWPLGAPGTTLPFGPNKLPYGAVGWTEAEFRECLDGLISSAHHLLFRKNPQATHVLDKFPGYSFHVAEIDQLFPSCRFIHIVRDGRDVACSLRAARRSLGFGDHADSVEAAAALWRQCIVEARAAAQHKERYLELRYEDLSTQGLEVLRSVFEFCGLPGGNMAAEEIYEAHLFEKMRAGKYSSDLRIPPEVKDFFRKGKVGSWEDEFSATDRYLFDFTAGDLLCELGYASPNWWKDSAHWSPMTMLRGQAVFDGRRLVRILRSAARNLLGVHNIQILRRVGTRFRSFPSKHFHIRR